MILGLCKCILAFHCYTGEIQSLHVPSPSIAPDTGSYLTCFVREMDGTLYSTMPFRTY